MIQKRSIGIVGSGNVGMASAYAIFMRGIASELILVDKDARKAEGEAMDLMHGQPYIGKISVIAGDIRELARAQVIIISAGVSQMPGETRLDLLNRNVAVLKDIVANLDTHAPEAIVILASNPVDILTYSMQQISARLNSRIIGTGTMLDTGRFRSILGQYYGVDPRSVHAYILGEHGDSEVPIWSTASIAGLTIVDNRIMGKKMDPLERRNLFETVRDSAYKIIASKGYTNTAIGSVIVRLVEAVLEDQKAVFTISARMDGEYDQEQVTLSVPSVIGLGGVEGKVLPVLNSEELEGLTKSADLLRKYIQPLHLQ